MILTVTPNVAVDRTIRVERLALGQAHRVRELHVQAGGKGLNVARVLASFGVPVIATGIIAGSAGQYVEHDLRAAGLAIEMLRVAGESRQTLTALASGGVDWIEFDEPGMAVDAADWHAFVSLVRELARRASVVVCSGSLPPGAPSDGYRSIIEDAHAAGASVVLDSSGAALGEALCAEPDIVKPNRHELAALVGMESSSVYDYVVASGGLARRGAKTVVTTLGPEGSIALDGTLVWITRHPPRRGNPVGAGDALTAGLAAGLSEGTSLAAALAEASAWALASLACDWAGTVDRKEAASALAEVRVEEWHEHMRTTGD